MNSIINYFIKDYKFNGSTEKFRSKALASILLTGIVLLIFFILKTILAGTYTSLYMQFFFLSLLVLSFILFKKGKQTIVANGFSLILVLTEVFSIFVNVAGAESYNFFVDEFYLMLAFLFFTSMFASKGIVILNTIIIIITSLTSFIYFKNDFPKEIVKEFEIGIGVYILVVIVIAVLGLIFSKIMYKAITEISEKVTETEEKNKLLADKTNELIKSQKDLNIAKLKAEESDHLKSAFLANMSHEIRTPMNAILGFTEIMKDTGLNQKQSEYIDIIANSGNHLLDLINDIIDISKLESNELKIEESKCNLNKFIEDIILFVKLSVRKDYIEHIRIETNFGLKNGEDRILTDTKRLNQILINIIGNALKFTNEGSVKISYEITETGQLLFKVTDTGIGIHKSQISIIFERFRQADETTTKLYGGTGLGLAISKACANLLGGEIWAESEKDKGSTFFFTIPYKPS